MGPLCDLARGERETLNLPLSKVAKPYPRGGRELLWLERYVDVAEVVAAALSADTILAINIVESPILATFGCPKREAALGCDLFGGLAGEVKIGNTTERAQIRFSTRALQCRLLPAGTAPLQPRRLTPKHWPPGKFDQRRFACHR